MTTKDNSTNNFEEVESAIAEDAIPNKEEKHLTKEQKRIIIAIVVVILIIGIAISGYFIYQKSRKIDLTNNTKAIEYGETYTPNVADFVNNNKINDTYSIDGNMPNEEGKNYPAIGNYLYTISAKNKESVKVTIKVQDTVAPVFDESSPSEIRTFKDVAITEDTLKNTFSVTDLSPVNLSINNVDYSKVGEYAANVSAADGSGNVTNKKITVIVEEPTISLEQSNVSISIGETTQLNATVQGANKTVTWDSSDTSIASVDENGIVTAIKAGTATITATANGVETTATINVTAQINNISSSVGSGSSKNSNSSSSRRNTSSSGSNNTSTASSSSDTSSSGSGSSSSSSGSHQHTMPTGNMGKWFDSLSSLKQYYNSVVSEWNNKADSGQISEDEYAKNCPAGYEYWSCATCGKWTGNFKYR